MQPNARHRQVESSFRELVRDAGLSPPDRVGYEPASVVFYWNRSHVAVCVDFERDDAGSLAPAHRV